MGAGVSAALVSAAGSADAAPGIVDDPASELELRALLLEEEKAIRQLHRAFEQTQDKELHDEVIGMFAEDAEVIFNGGLFRNRRGVSRLYRERFRAGRSGRRMEPAPGFDLAAGPEQESVQVSPDRLSATAVFPCSIQVGSPFETGNSLTDMARLHGEGVRTWWEGGEYHVTYRKDVTGGRWMISRLEYRTLARADYRPGRTYAEPLAVAPFSTRFPGDQLGPDELV
jgi:carotenoid cleavage dioxygenase